MTMGMYGVFLGAAENRVKLFRGRRTIPNGNYAAVNEGLIVYSLGIVVNA